MPWPNILAPAPIALPPDEFTMSWAYAWVAVGGLVLAFLLTAFVVLVARRHGGRLRRTPALRSMDRALSKRFPRVWSFIRRRFGVNEWYGLALTITAVVTFTAVYIFALLTEGWMEQEAVYVVDLQVNVWLAETADTGLINIMRIVTHLGDGETVTLVSIVLGGALLAYGRRWQVVSLVLSVGVGALVMHGLKWIFERSRPAEQVIGAAGHSFPSGHAFMATTLYGWMIYFTWRALRQDAARILATVVLALMIVMTGISRIVLRVHWASDVAGGITIGLAWLVCSLLLVRAVRAYFVTGQHIGDAAPN